MALEPLRRLVGKAGWRLRTARALRDGSRTLIWVLVSIALAALILEIGWGLRPVHLLLLSAALLLPVGAVIRALVTPPGPVRSAKALDVGAELHDRIGTALALGGMQGGLVDRQRADALDRAAGLRVGSAIPIALLRRVRGPAAALLVLFAVVAVCLAFDLRPPRAEAPVSALEESGEDLLAVLGGIEEDAVAQGNKRLERSVTDLHDRVKKIVEEERKRREEVQDEEPPPPPPPNELAPVLPEEAAAPDGLYSVSELDAMHTQLQLDLAGAMDFNLESVRRAASDVIRKDPAMRRFSQEIDNQMLAEPDMFDRADTRKDSTTSNFRGNHNPMSNTDTGMGMELKDQVQEQVEESAVDDFTAESLAADDKKHALQMLFKEFLEEYSADRGEQIADWLAGKNPDGPRVAVDDGSQMPDKTDAMAESGFEDVSDDPYDKTEKDDSYKPVSADEIPEGAEVQTLDDAAGMGEGAAGMGEGTTETTKGAQGAGRGDGSVGGEEEERVLPTLPGAELEQILGQVTDDELPPERQRELLEEVATHKIHGGLANDFGDQNGNYFEEADRILLEESDELPPLFRDYAHEYFQALLDL